MPEPLDGIFDSDDPTDNADLLVEHENLFLDNKDNILTAIESIISDYHASNAGNQIYESIRIAFSGTDVFNRSDEEIQDAEKAIITYMQGLFLDSYMIDAVSKHNPSDEFMDFMINSILEYGNDIQRINFYQSQGQNWWSHVRTERVLDDDSIKHKHKITIDRREELDIDSSPYSDWVLAEHFLNKILESVQISEEPIENMIDFDYLNQIRRLVYYYEELISGTDYESQLESKEILIEKPQSEDK